ncbi:PAS domain-containing sensor histidine kinase [Algoriphagus vanfongensis]|uniref:PAS domain-containing sensor histidine kinase n=1 Tax=Algoriphagus vanfongensis TaxID=426371 RepID=UPI00042592F8|nr:PAS domain S-box protein [Algoriphagus vanfongensis]
MILGGNSIVDYATNAIIATDLKGKVVYSNYSAEVNLGYSTGGLLGMNGNLLFGEVPDFSLFRITERILFNESVPEIRLTLKTTNGVLLSYFAQFSPIKDRNQQIIGISCVLRSINSSDFEEGKATGLLEVMNKPTIIVNRLGQIVLVNTQLEKKIGYTKQEVLGEMVEVLFSPNHKNSFSKAWNPSIEILKKEVIALRKDRSSFSAHISISPVRINDETYFSIIVQDIAEFESSSNQVDVFNQLLEFRSKEIKQLSFAATHSLQEPLKRISALSFFLLNEYKSSVDSAGIQSIEYIREAADNLSLLIKELMSYCLLGQNRMPEKFQLQSIWGQIRSQVLESNKILNPEIFCQELPEVYGDKNELKLLLTNLISNSLKFRNENSTPKIDFSWEERDKDYLFCLGDNGIGVEDKNYLKIFLLFNKLNQKFDGYGMGLAICQKIVELHGGKIWLDSKVGEGTKFYFALPKRYQQ